MSLTSALRQVFNEAVNDAVLSEAPENTPEASTRELETIRHDYSIDENRDAKDVGHAETNSGTKTKEKLRSQKKKDEAAKLSLMLNEVIEGLDNMLGDMSDIINDMRVNDRKIRKGIEILKENDIEAAHIFLSQEYGVDTTGKTDEEVMDEVAEKTGQTIYDQKQLFKEFRDTVEEYKLKTGGIESKELKDQYDGKLDVLEQKAAEFALDFEKVFEDVHEETGYNLNLLKERDGQNFDTEQISNSSIEPAIKASIELEGLGSALTIGEAGKGILTEQFTASATPKPAEEEPAPVADADLDGLAADLGIDMDGLDSVTSPNSGMGMT